MSTHHNLLFGRICFLISAYLLCLLPSEVACSQQGPEPSWEFFRGPNFDGHSDETGLVDSWPEAGPPVLWTRKLGQGYSSFVGRGDRVFTQYQTIASQFVVCLDAATGETLWEHRYGWSYQTAGLYPGPRATPTLDEDKLYFSGPRGRLGCLTQQDGHLIWEVDLIEVFGAKPVDFGYACSPVIVDETLLLPVGGPGSAVVAFDKYDGSVIWKSGDYEISYASLLPIQRAGRDIVVAYLRNALVLLDQKDGRVLSELPLSKGYDEHSTWPIYREPYLWLSAPFRAGSRLLRLTTDDPPLLVPVWNSEFLSNDVCSSVLVDGSLYGFDIRDVQSKVHRPSRGQFRCIDFETGAHKWVNGSPNERRELQPEPGTDEYDSVGHSSLIYADNKLILVNDTGEVILLAANPDRFEQLARVRVLGGEICWTQPMLQAERLYLRNSKRAACLYLGDPQRLLESNTETLSVSDIPQSAYFDLASWVFRVEPEYAMDAPTGKWLIQWYGIMLACGWLVAFPLATMVAWLAARLTRLRNTHLIRRILFRSVAIVIGVLGTTVISHWVNDFIFTWPLVLAVVFEMLTYQTRMRRAKVTSDTKAADSRAQASNGQNTDPNPWPGRLALIAFLAICTIYFYMCRRLSLAFEWSFLIGFPAAVPLLLWSRRFANSTARFAGLAEWLLTAMAFTAFYWSGAALILLKY